LASSMASGSFEWSEARIDHMYPSAEILAEIGRVAIAATRVDQEVALVLLALKFPERFEMLLKLNSSQLRKKLQHRTHEFFENELLEHTEGVLNLVQDRLENRHLVMHSIWTPEDRETFLSAEALETVQSQEDLDKLIRERGAAAKWRAFSPRGDGPGPETVEELTTIRRELEDAQDWLMNLRFRLASALFAGKPAGARKVLNPKDL
jgi:hypothetical protein